MRARIAPALTRLGCQQISYGKMFCLLFVAQERGRTSSSGACLCRRDTKKNAFMPGHNHTIHRALCFNSTNRCVTIDIVMETVYSIYWRTSRKIIAGARFPMFYGLGNWKSKDLTKLVCRGKLSHLSFTASFCLGDPIWSRLLLDVSISMLVLPVVKKT